MPDVHGYSIDVDPSIGSPYIILAYIGGFQAAYYDDDVGKDRHVQKQLAKMMIDLASHKFDQIGSLRIDAEGQFSIGKDMSIDAGPFKTAEDYYSALAIHHFHDFTKYHFLDNISAEGYPALYLPFMFNNYMRMYTESASDHGPFSLVYPGLGVHSLVLDTERNVVCVNDVDNIIAAPLHVVAQMPSSCVLNSPLPGLITTNQERAFMYEEGIPECTRFAEIFKDEERRYDPLTPISNAMQSDAARLVEGLNKYSEMNIECCNEWIRSYLYMYYRRQGGNSLFQDLGRYWTNILLGEAVAKKFSEAVLQDEDKTTEREIGGSGPNDPYSEDEDGDKLDIEPESPLTPIVLKRKPINALLGLNEDEQADITRVNSVLEIDEERRAKEAIDSMRLKLSQMDLSSTKLRPSVREVLDERLVSKDLSSLSKDFPKSTNKPPQPFQQPMSSNAARMVGKVLGREGDSIRTTYGDAKAFERFRLMFTPYRSPNLEREGLSHGDPTQKVDDTMSRSVTDTSNNATGGIARPSLDNDGEAYENTSVVQEEHRDSGLYDETHPLLWSRQT